jgi:hypothetical protein
VTYVADGGQPRVGAVVEDMIAPLACDGMLELIAAGEEELIRLVDRARGSVPLADAHLCAPVLNPGKIICIGLNHRDHAAESGMEIPPVPVVFAKWANALCGHGDPIRLRAAIEVHDTVEDAWVTLWLDTEDGDRLCGFSEPVGTVAAGEVVRVHLEAANPLASGRYGLGWSLERGIGVGDFAAFQPRAAELLVFGGDAVGGRVAVEHRMVVEHGAHHDRAMSG